MGTVSLIFQVYERYATFISTCAYVRAGVSGKWSYHPYFEYPRSVQDSTTLWAKVSARIMSQKLVYFTDGSAPLSRSLHLVFRTWVDMVIRGAFGRGDATLCLTVRGANEADKPDQPPDFHTCLEIKLPSSTNDTDAGVRSHARVRLFSRFCHRSKRSVCCVS
jgi:hypothetical protein